MEPIKLRRHTPEERVELSVEIAKYFEDELLYVRSVELDETESELPLTDLDCDGMLLVRLAAAFDGYDFEFAPENEPHYYRFFVHLLAVAMCPLITDGHDLDQAFEDAKAALRQRRDEEQDRRADEDSRFIVPLFGAENFDDL